MLSGSVLCEELITRPEESYRIWCVVVYDLENLVNEEALANWEGFCPQNKTNIIKQRETFVFPIPNSNVLLFYVCGYYTSELFAVLHFALLHVKVLSSS